jgi:hypothetical protein
MWIFSPRISTTINIAALLICELSTIHLTLTECLNYMTRLASSTRPAADPGLLTGSTTLWKQVRSWRSGPGGALIFHVPFLATEAESSSVSRQERLAKLAAFQLQMLRHAMKCMSHTTLPYPYRITLVIRRVVQFWTAGAD